MSAADAAPAPLPPHKTKIVATIGPASDAPEMLERLIRAGMGIARLNFSHGDFPAHATRIERIRAAERAVGRAVSILADLPGPKLRIGDIAPEPLAVRAGDELTLTTGSEGGAGRIPVAFDDLPRVVRRADRMYLSDGLIQLVVEETTSSDVRCRVVAGGELRSRAGLNLPGIDLGIPAFTDRDRECLAFAIEHGVDAVGQSFVASAADIVAVRSAAGASGRRPFVVAKIERAVALERFEEILAAADGIMVARGDLGVELPLEEIAIVQKRLIARANLAGKPVITATQMLESMVSSRRPTRAEATDVANAILDGTDAVMLSAESAMGSYPVDAVSTLARIATHTEAHRPKAPLDALRALAHEREATGSAEALASIVQHALDTVPCDAVLVPTRGGATARMISSFKPTLWILAACADPEACRGLRLSYGVHAFENASEHESWEAIARRSVARFGLAATRVLLVAGPSPAHPEANLRIEMLNLAREDRDRSTPD